MNFIFTTTWLPHDAHNLTRKGRKTRNSNKTEPCGECSFDDYAKNTPCQTAYECWNKRYGINGERRDSCRCNSTIRTKFKKHFHIRQFQCLKCKVIIDAPHEHKVEK